MSFKISPLDSDVNIFYLNVQSLNTAVNLSSCLTWDPIFCLEDQ